MNAVLGTAGVALGLMACVLGALTMLVALVRREPIERADLGLGALVGLANAAQLEFLMRAMESLPAVIVFPVSSALSLVLTTIGSVWWWNERLSRGAALGLALALVATVLLNL